MIVGALLARNESGRYLERVLANAASLCDQLIVLDDASTDATPDICAAAGATVLSNSAPAGWTAEAGARATLWNAAAKAAGPDGWIYVFDADHLMHGHTRDSFAALASAEHVNCWGFVLWDCWDAETTHRVDGHWQAWRFPRPWLAKAVPHASFVPEWSRRDVHVGHLPANYPIQVATAPGGIAHLGYVKAADRTAKAAKYLALNAPTP